MTILAREENSLAIATLSAEASLNSLTLDMVQELHKNIEGWNRSPSVHAIFLEGAGTKAFCAGGDVRRLHAVQGKNRDKYGEEFFEREYRLDYMIHTSRKPVIVWGSGIVMGGGLGLMAGGQMRIVTESTRIAMPEITIGLFPDVGGSYFLNRMPDNWGIFLALTGARMNAADAEASGLADFFIAADKKAEVVQALQKMSWSEDLARNKENIRQVLLGFDQASRSKMPASQLRKHANFIAKVTHAADASELFANFKRAATEAALEGAPTATDTWLKGALETFLRGSPTSAAVTYEQIKRGKRLSLKECFMQELILAQQCLRHHDFFEGVRALLIDKDNRPKWSPDTVEKVSPSLVEEHFTAPWGSGLHPMSDLI